MKRVLNAAIALLVAVTLTACSPFDRVCPAIGYSSTLIVTPASPASDLHLEFCSEPGCIPGATTPEAMVSGDGVSGWTITFLISDTDVFVYRITDAAGAVISEGSVAPEWVRVDGSAECGGNVEARVTL